MKPSGPFALQLLAAFSALAGGHFAFSQIRGTSLDPLFSQAPQAQAGAQDLAGIDPTDGPGSLCSAVERAQYGACSRSSGQSPSVKVSNPAQHLSAVFDSSGAAISFHPGANAPQGTISWRLLALEREGGPSVPVPGGSLQADGQRVEISRTAPAVMEWYINKPSGLEHGFTLPSRPVPEHAAGSLRIKLEAGGDLKPRLAADGESLELHNCAGTVVLRYQKLIVWDADQKPLPACMKVEGVRVVIEVQDSSARYPVTVDPEFVIGQTAYLKADRASGAFGFAVAAAKNLVAVGTPMENLEDGAVYVFRKGEEGWIQEARLESEGDGERFGAALDMSGDILVVGAPSAIVSIGGTPSQGSVYTYRTNGSGWTLVSRLQEPASNQYGAAVAISGNTLVVGAPAERGQFDNSFSQGPTGAAYIYTGSSSWGRVARCEPDFRSSSASGFPRFGDSVAVDGMTVLVGMPGDGSDAIGVNDPAFNQSGIHASGAVYEFEGPTWLKKSYIKAPLLQGVANFGSSVAITGNDLFVGAPGDGGWGKLYALKRSGHSWVHSQSFEPIKVGSRKYFGDSCAVSGNILAVGAPAAPAGETYVFARDVFNGLWGRKAALNHSNPDAGDVLGTSVDVFDGKDAIIVSGAPNEDSNATGINGNGADNSASNSGAAYIFSARDYRYFPSQPVPLLGGLRSRFPLDGTMITSVRAFVDTNKDDKLSAGEISVPCEELRIGLGADGKPEYAFFRLPPYSGQWPADRPEGGQEVALWMTTSGGTGSHAPMTAVYTHDVVAMAGAVSEQLAVAFAEASREDATLPSPFERLRTWGAEAGARAETLLHQIFRYARPLGLPGEEELAMEERDALTSILETLPQALADGINTELGQSLVDFEAMVLPINDGHSEGRKPRPSSEIVLLTLGTGTVAIGAPGTAPSTPQPSGGRLYLWVDMEAEQPLISIQGDTDEAYRWNFEIVPTEKTGFDLRNLTAYTEDRIPAREQVARRISMPAIGYDENTYTDLELPHLSHVYVCRDLPVHPAIPDDHAHEHVWMMTATYRIPFDGSQVLGTLNALPKPALVARQSYAVTEPFSHYEPLHALISASVYPQVAFSLSIPDGSPGPSSVSMTHRLALNPQHGDPTTPGGNQYVWGVFKEQDHPKWWLSSKFPGATANCGPVPLWWNLFENSEHTVPYIDKESLFDTDTSDIVLPTPDNIHLNQRHTEQRFWAFIPGLEPHADAPGSFNGGLHLHWRWAEGFGDEFGNGLLLLPGDQHWTIGVARSNFPVDFDDFESDINTSLHLGLQEKVMLVHCDQNNVEPQRQYHSFTTGFSYSLGVEHNNVLTDFILGVGGYDFVAGYRKWGWDNSISSRSVRLVQSNLMEHEWKRLSLVAGGAIVGASLSLLTSPILAPLIVVPSVLVGIASELAVDFHLGREACLSNIDADSLFHRLARDGRRGRSVSTLPYHIVRVPSTLQADCTPWTMDSATTGVSFFSTASNCEFVAATNVLQRNFGYCWAQGAETPSAALKIVFDAPVREVRNLCVGAVSSSLNPNVAVTLLEGTQTLSTQSFTLTKLPGGLVPEALLNLKAAGPFTSLIINAVSPDDRLIVGGFQYTRHEIPEGDLNYDGQVDTHDAVMFQLAYTGSGAAVPFWSRDADLDQDGDVDGLDYASLAAVVSTPPASMLVVAAAPSAALEPVSLGATVSLAVTASELTGGTVSYEWTAEAGTFDSPSTGNVVWTAPQGIGKPYDEIALTLKLTSSAGSSRTLTFVQPVQDKALYGTWAFGYGLTTPETAAHTADVDGDGYSNFSEFAFGTDPLGFSAAPVVEDGVLISHGLPTFAPDTVDPSVGVLTYCRRRDALSRRLEYRPEFSSDTVQWKLIQGFETILAEDSAVELVQLRVPLIGHSRRLFSRLTVTLH